MFITTNWYMVIPAGMVMILGLFISYEYIDNNVTSG